MRIQFKTSLGLAEARRFEFGDDLKRCQEGSIVDVEDEVATELITRGFAVTVGEPTRPRPAAAVKGSANANASS